MTMSWTTFSIASSRLIQKRGSLFKRPCGISSSTALGQSTSDDLIVR